MSVQKLSTFSDNIYITGTQEIEDLIPPRILKLCFTLTDKMFKKKKKTIHITKNFLLFWEFKIYKNHIIAVVFIYGTFISKIKIHSHRQFSVQWKHKLCLDNVKSHHQGLYFLNILHRRFKCIIKIEQK